MKYLVLAALLVPSLAFAQAADKPVSQQLDNVPAQISIGALGSMRNVILQYEKTISDLHDQASAAAAAAKAQADKDQAAIADLRKQVAAAAQPAPAAAHP